MNPDPKHCLKVCTNTKLLLLLRGGGMVGCCLYIDFIFAVCVAMELENEEKVKDVIQKSLSKGVITDWFLFCDKALRIAPPLNINKTVLKESCDVIVSCL